MTDFDLLYLHHRDSLLAFGQQFTADSELLKDCVQDVFVKCYAKRDVLCSEVQNMENYLCTALRNRISDEHRRSARLTAGDTANEWLADTAEADEAGGDTAEGRQSLYENIERFIGLLSPRQQQVVRLHVLEQRDYDDCCRAMGISYQSVRNLMHRSICRLRAALVKSEE